MPNFLHVSIFVEAFLASLPTPDVESSTSPAAELDTVLEPDRVAEVVEPDTEPLEISQVEAPKVTCHLLLGGSLRENI